MKTNKEYSILISSRAQKDYKKLSSQTRSLVTKKIQSLKTNPFPAQSKKMVGEDMPMFRLRVGDYRVLYDVYETDAAILILHIGHRREVYR